MKRARWDKLRVWGCDAYHLIPNGPLAKLPGIVKGRKVIFAGFTPGCNGYRLFHPSPESTQPLITCTFYKSFKHRIDALRYHDKRRALIEAGKNQPV